MESDDFRMLPLVEVTPNGLPDFGVEFRKSIRLGENRSAQRTRRVAPFGCFLNDKDQLVHSPSPTQ